MSDPNKKECSYSEKPNSSDTISRQAAIDALRMDIDIIPFAKAREYARAVIETIHNRLEELPSVQPKRKTGKWNFIGENMFECTSCGVVYTTEQLNGLRNYDTDPYAPKFCPNCGADMRGEQDG